MTLSQDYNGELSKSFPVFNGVNQGCVLAQALFSMMFSTVLSDAFTVGINIKFHIDGNIFNLKRLEAKTKVSSHIIQDLLFAYNHIIRDLLFADDHIIRDLLFADANSETDLQNSMSRFSKTCSNFG